MKKMIAVLLALTSISVASASQQCTATCVVTDTSIDKVVVKKSLAIIAKDAVEALEDFDSKCFEAGHYAIENGHSSTREVQDLKCNVLRAKAKSNSSRRD